MTDFKEAYRHAYSNASTARPKDNETSCEVIIRVFLWTMEIGGYVLAPIEATHRMLIEANPAIDTAEQDYRVMIAARPKLES